MAGRYAMALFELAHDTNQLDETAAALRTIEVLLNESQDLSRLVRSPVFSASEQASAIIAIAKQAQLPTLISNFLQLLVKNRRLFALRDIISGFRTLLADYRNEVTAEITSAVQLNEAQAEDLKATLKAKTGRDITLNLRVDPSILGGLIVRIGSRMVDSSIRTKLSTLKMAMKEVG